MLFSLRELCYSVHDSSLPTLSMILLGNLWIFEVVWVSCFFFHHAWRKVCTSLGSEGSCSLRNGRWTCHRFRSTLMVTFLLAPRTRVIDWIWVLSPFSLITGTVTSLLYSKTNWVTEISLLKATEKQTEECGFNWGSWILVLSSV